MKPRLSGQAIALVANIASEPRVAPILRTGDGATVERAVSAMVSDDLLESFAAEIVACPVHASAGLNSHFDGSDIKTIGSVTGAKVNRAKKQVEVEFVLWRSDYPDLVAKVKDLFDSGLAAISWEILYQDDDVEIIQNNGTPAMLIKRGIASGIAILKSTAAAFGKRTPVLALAGSEPQTGCVGSLLDSHSKVHAKYDEAMEIGLTELLAGSLQDEHSLIAGMLGEFGIVHNDTNSWLDNGYYDISKGLMQTLSLPSSPDITASLKEIVTLREAVPDGPLYATDGAYSIGTYGYVVRTGENCEVIELLPIGDFPYGVQPPVFERPLPSNSIFVLSDFYYPVDIWVLEGFLLPGSLEERRVVAHNVVGIVPPPDYTGVCDYSYTYSIAAPFVLYHGPQTPPTVASYAMTVAGTGDSPWILKVDGKRPASLQAHFRGLGKAAGVLEAFEAGATEGIYGIDKSILEELSKSEGSSRMPMDVKAFASAYTAPSADNAYEVCSVHLDLRIDVGDDKAIGWSVFSGVAFREIHTGELLIPARPRLLQRMSAGAVPKPEFESAESVDLGTLEPVAINDSEYLVQLGLFSVVMLMQTPDMSEFYIMDSTILDNGRWMATLISNEENIFLLRKVVSDTPYIIGKDKEAFENTHEKIGENYETNVDNLQFLPDNVSNSEEEQRKWQ